MIRRMVIVQCVIALCLVALACQRISPAPQRLLAVEPTKALDAISSDYGSLVSVTMSTPNSALLWFEKPDKTIVIVGLRMDGDRVSLVEKTVLIPRSQ